MKSPGAINPIPVQIVEPPVNPVAIEPSPRDAESQSLYRLIARQPLFMGLQASHLQLLTASALKMEFETGQSLLQEGSPANRFYLILEGKVLIEAEMADRNKIAIQTLGPGDEVGWAWLFPPYSDVLSARALEPTRTIFFYGTRLREQCEQDHELGYQIMQRVAQMATQCLRATQRQLVELAGTKNLDR